MESKPFGPFPVPDTIGQAFDNLVKTMEMISKEPIPAQMKQAIHASFLAGATAFYHISCTQTQEGFQAFLIDFLDTIAKEQEKYVSAIKH